MEYPNGSVGGAGYIGGVPTSSVGNQLSATPKVSSEFEREASRLNLSICHAQDCIQKLAQKLAPILRPITTSQKGSEKTPGPSTQHAQFLSVQGDKVEQINEAFHQLLESIEI